MKTYIPLLLDRTAEELQERKYRLFLRWAMKSSFNDTDAQHIITSQKIYNWFNTQVNQLESEFIESVANSRVTAQSTMELHSLYIIKIDKALKLFPVKLLNSVRKGKKYQHYKFNLN